MCVDVCECMRVCLKGVCLLQSVCMTITGALGDWQVHFQPRGRVALSGSRRLHWIPSRQDAGLGAGRTDRQRVAGLRAGVRARVHAGVGMTHTAQKQGAVLEYIVRT